MSEQEHIEEQENVEEIDNIKAAIEQAEDAPRYFSNVVRLMSNINGVSFLFGEVYPVGMGSAESQSQSVCLVQMSMVNAKSLYLILKQQLSDYEEKWGEIPVHPNLAERFGNEL